MPICYIFASGEYGKEWPNIQPGDLCIAISGKKFMIWGALRAAARGAKTPGAGGTHVLLFQERGVRRA